MHRNANRAGLVSERASDRLADPPGRVGREFVAFGVVKFINRLEETEVPFLDKIEECQVRRASDVFLRDRDNEPQVRAREQILRLFVSFSDALGKLALLHAG